MNRQLLLLCVFVSCGSRAGRYQAAVDKGKHLKIEKKIAALFERDRAGDRDERAALHAVWGNAVAADLRETNNPARLHWFREEFAAHPLQPEMLELAAKQAFADVPARRGAASAVYPAREAALIALSRAYAPSPTAKQAAELAAKERLESIRLSGGDPWAYREFAIRYPEVNVRREAQDAVLMWARTQGTPEAWKDVLDGWPEHPLRSEMVAEYRKVAWGEILEGDASQATLWSFARQFYGSKEAEEAVQEGLAKSVSLEAPDGQPMHSIKLQFGATPPAGYGLSVDVEVDGVSWRDASTARLNVLAPLAPITPMTEDVVQEGTAVTYKVDRALCATTSDERFEVVIQISDGDRTLATRRVEVPSVRRCQTTRRMVFSQQDNDVDGPLWSTSRDASGAWTLTEYPWRIPASVACTHVTNLSRWGAFVECGTLEVLVGWDPGEFWVRETDGSQRRTERADVHRVDKTLDNLRVRGTGTRRRLYDTRGRTLAKLGVRDAVVAELPHDVVLEGICDACDPGEAAPSIPAEVERPGTSGLPLPEGAVTSEGCPSISTVDAEVWSVSSNKQLLLVEAPVRPDEELPEALRGWVQALIVPGQPGRWQCFEWEDHVYTRTVASDGRNKRVLTLRAGSDQWILDQTGMP